MWAMLNSRRYLIAFAGSGKIHIKIWKLSTYINIKHTRIQFIFKFVWYSHLIKLTINLHLPICCKNLLRIFSGRVLFERMKFDKSPPLQYSMIRYMYWSSHCKIEKETKAIISQMIVTVFYASCNQNGKSHIYGFTVLLLFIQIQYLKILKSDNVFMV